MAEHTNIEEIIDFRNHYVFEGVGITTAIVSLNKATRSTDAHVFQLQVPNLLPTDLADKKTNENIFHAFFVDQHTFDAEPWTFTGSATQGVLDKIDAAGEVLGNVLIIGQGMQTGRNNVFGKLDQTQVDEWGLHKEHYFIRARNSGIGRYYIQNSGEYLLFVEDVKQFNDLPESVKDYLLQHEKELTARAAYRRGDCEWWKYTWPLHKAYLKRAKLYCPYLATHNRFALDERQQYLGLTDTTVLYDADQSEDLRYLMGLLNSKLLTFRFRFIGKLKSNGILEYFWNSVSKLPIKRINFSNMDDKLRHDRMVELVNQMLTLHENLAAAKISQEKTIIQRQIEATDRQIDQLVYELYGLSEEEIRIVEESTA